MRRLADAGRIRAFMDAVGRAAKREIRLYFTGGATAVLSGWRPSTIDVDILMIPSPAIERKGKVAYYHYDLYAQALAKIERGHAQDEADVEEMIRRRVIDQSNLMRHFEQIEPLLYRFPAIDAATFRRSVERVCRP